MTRRIVRADWLGPALLLGVVFAILVVAGDRLLADPDTQWHVAVGARIWADRALPWTDVFSHTFAGAPWIAKEWLSQLILAGAAALAGWRGVVLLAAGTIAVLFAALFAHLAARLRGTLALALTVVAILLVAPHALARPHVFALLALFAWARSLTAAAEAGRTPAPSALLIVVAWANLHGSVTVAPVIAGAFAADGLLRAARPARARLAGRWMLFGLGTVAACCATPYGPWSMLVTGTLFGSGESLPFVAEWQPLDLDAVGIVAAMTAALALLVLAAEPRRNAARIGLLFLLAAMTARHGRFLDLYAIVAPLLVAEPVLRRFPGLGPEAPAAAGAFGRRAVGPLCLAGLAATTVLAALATDPRPPGRVTPAAALAAARAAGLTEHPVYNAYDFGGVLIAEGIPTFIDGRTDQLFLGGFISGLYAAVRAEPDAAFAAFLDRYPAGWALVRPDTDEARHFERLPGWRRLYRDADAAVYRRDPALPGR